MLPGGKIYNLITSAFLFQLNLTPLRSAIEGNKKKSKPVEYPLILSYIIGMTNNIYYPVLFSYVEQGRRR